MSVVEFDSAVTDLGIILHNQLSMALQVTAVSRSCFYQMRQLRVVQRSLTKDALRSLVQAFIHCLLDYCNTLLAGITDTQIKWLQPLQSVQNIMARLVSGARWQDHITSVLHTTQPPLASGAAKDHFQHCGPRMEMHPWCRTCKILHAGGECSRTPSTVVSIDWMCRPAKSTDVGGPA